ncbi:MAG: hypothetical protein AB7O97_16810 [Planctomycetota bacterium]
MGRFLRRLLAVHCELWGRLAFRLGRRAHARRQFERVLRLGGDEFTAYVHLGRIALGEGDFAGYRREMGNARACDPERFARLRPAADGIETRAAGTPFEETGERATWRSVRPGGPGMTRRTPVRSAELPTENLDDSQRHGPLFELPLGLGEYTEQPRPRMLRDDFCSNTERERFRRLPPIRGEDVRAADFDELARRLGG